MKYYSPTEKGFFDKSIHTNIPADCIEVSEENYNKLIQAQCNGLELVFDGVKLITQEFVKNPKHDLEVSKYEAQKYLDSTDYYFTVDKYAQLSVSKRIELETKRQAARVVISSTK